MRRLLADWHGAHLDYEPTGSIETFGPGSLTRFQTEATSMSNARLTENTFSNERFSSL